MRLFLMRTSLKNISQGSKIENKDEEDEDCTR